MQLHVVYRVVLSLPRYLLPCLSDGCLGPGFTQTLPPQDELSQYSTTVLQPGDKAIYTALSFRCNGTLESLTIPSEIRGSVHPRADDLLEPRPSIWRLTDTGYYSFFESVASFRVITGNGALVLADGDVRLFSFTVMLQVNIQAGDVLGFQALNSRMENGIPVIEHLPLLYKPGPTPGSFTPVILATFVPTSVPDTGEYT